MRWLDALLGTALAAVLFSTSFREGWSRVETDFPNYYTGAAATRAGLPLKDFYDWTWFQREMNYTGTERQLGAYTPQTPLAMLPFLPIAGIAPQRAKQVWLSLNAILLACLIILLVAVSDLSYRWVFLIFLAGYGSIHANFLLGQYYVFLAFLLALAVFFFFRGREASTGSALGLMFVLKLYSGPFLLFFLVKRSWRAVAGFVGVAVAGALVSISMFGWAANRFYVESILPSVMSGMLIDPYNPGLGSMTALFRRSFVSEPELNPHPMFQWPAAFTFCQTLFSVGIMLMVLLALNRREKLTKREFAWLIVALLLLAPVNATYVFILLAIPVALLMPECGILGKVVLLGAMAITSTPLPREVAVFFPRAFVLVILFLWAGAFTKRRGIVVFGAAAVIALVVAFRPIAREPFERIVQPGYSIAVMEPAVTVAGPIYHGFGNGRYVLHTASRSYSFEGHAFHPAANPRGGPVLFELVDHGHSRIMSLDLATGLATERLAGMLHAQQPAISPDGTRVAFVVDGRLWIDDAPLGFEGRDPSFSADGKSLLYARNGKIYSLGVLIVDGEDLRHPVMSPDGTMLAYTSGRQIWWKRLPDGKAVQLTSASCNHDSPVWEADGRHLLFTSDCGRGLGLPALYRAEVSETRARQGPR